MSQHYQVTFSASGNGRYVIPRKFFTLFEAKLYCQGMEDKRLHEIHRKNHNKVSRHQTGTVRPPEEYIDRNKPNDLNWINHQRSGMVAERTNIIYTIELLDGPVDVPLLGKVSD